MFLARGFNLVLDEAVEGEEEVVGRPLAVALDKFLDGGCFDVVRLGRVANW